MKRLILLSFVLLANISFAQLDTLSLDNNVTKLTRLRNGTEKWLNLYKDESIQFYYLLTPSDNRYDDLYTIVLGETIESSIQSLDDLIEVATTKDKSIYIKDMLNDELNIFRPIIDPNSSIKGSIHIKADGYAGYGVINYEELVFAKEFLNGEKEPKLKSPMDVLSTTLWTTLGVSVGVVLIALLAIGI